MTKTKTSTENQASYPKTDSRYWHSKLFKRSNDLWHCQIGFAGRQERWPLQTANREQAATKARDIWLSLRTHGFEATEAKFKPWTLPQVEPTNAGVSVGEFIRAVKAVALVKPATFTTYERKLRFLVSQLAKVKGSRSKFDYVHGGAGRWRGQIDNVPLADLTPQRITEWRVRYISKFDKQPLKRQSAQSTAASIIRNAKALFAPRILRNLGLALPSPLPFDGVDLGKRPRTRYQSKIDAAALVTAAHNELKIDQPELFKIFLLAVGAGLRRGEVDRLTWKAFDWKRGVLSIQATEYGTNKTEASNDEIDLGADLLAYFKSQMKHGQGEFVIASNAAATAAPHWHRYRCDGTFKLLLDWLRTKGVVVRNPMHTLRKEFGSLINQKFGIYAASAALRHSNISITRESYVSKKERTAIDLSELMAGQTA